MKTAYVSTNLLDMRAEPDHHAERVSQALFGEPVAVGGVRNGFARIRQADSYTGWVDRRFLVETIAPNSPRRRKQVVISAPQARVYDRGRRAVTPYLVFYGTVLSAGTVKEDLLEVILPDGAKVFVKSRATSPIMRVRTRPVTGAALVREARKFLGVPYLWGGVTTPGFDCSGLVQTVARRFGIYLPRDTKDQIRVGHQVDRGRIKTGDLLFFDRHVGLAVGSHRLIHSSRGGGGVRINSLRRGDPDYREDLDRNFAQARRLL